MKQNIERKISKDLKGLFREVKKEELKYENLLLLILFFILAYILTTPKHFQALKLLIEVSGEYGHIGIFIAGFFFAYGFTAPISTVVLIGFGSIFNPFLIAFVGAVGATIGDFVVFKLSKRKLSSEIEKYQKRPYLKKYSKLIHHLAPLIAGFLIASPLPDEFGAAILGSLRFTDKKFVIFIFAAEFIGIFILAMIGSVA